MQACWIYRSQSGVKVGCRRHSRVRVVVCHRSLQEVSDGSRLYDVYAGVSSFRETKREDERERARAPAEYCKL